MTKPLSFSELGINEEVVLSIKEMGINEPFPVQKKTIPLILSGKNLIVQSPTGSGKTLAYLLPLMEKINLDTKDLEILILAPSRELVMQIKRLLKKFPAKYKTATAIGGTNLGRQMDDLKDKPKILVGTPGRVLELFQKKKINGQVIRTIVVDEVDKMFSQGFMQDVKLILARSLKTSQRLFFSATIPEEIVEHAHDYMIDPEMVDCLQRKVPETIKHYYFVAKKMQKINTLHKILKAWQPTKALIFVQRNEGVQSLVNRLREMGHNAWGMHSSLSQIQRKAVMEQFRERKVPLLITTDLLARGLDIPGIDYIFNFDVPLDLKHYIHRVGRTGRAGKEGNAVTLVSEEQKFIMHKYAQGLAVQFNLMGVDEHKIFPVVHKNKKEVSLDGSSSSEHKK